MAWLVIIGVPTLTVVLGYVLYRLGLGDPVEIPGEEEL
jgi:hypothetical protein